jgi:6-phosphogluconolactonase
MNVYVSNADSREIGILSLDPKSGDVTPIERVTVSGTVMPLALSPDRRFLYAALRSEPFSIASFSVDQHSGRLAHISTVPIPASMPYIATDRAGRFLLSASYQSSLIAVSPIAADGAVEPQPVTEIATQPKAHAIMTDPSNRFVYVSSLGGDIVHCYRFDAATGRLSPNDARAVHVKPGAGPRHFVFHPSGRFLYLLNELDASLIAYAFDARSGALTEIGSVSALPPGFAGTPSAADLHATPDGRFLYASERASSTIAAFRVDAASGMLSAIGNVETETVPRGFNIDAHGRFLLAVGLKSNAMTVYAIDGESGRLDARGRYPMGEGPNWVEIVAFR